MNEIITNGTAIKQRIIAEIEKASQNIFLAMAWFTDRDIANAIITAKNRNLVIDIILSSNVQNETVKQMFKDANISIHAFETGDERGVMHHKFCLIDNKISINGSYNYSYNASSNNVVNIQISDDPETYRQLYAEFERLKYNIDHQIDVNINTANPMEQVITKSKSIKPVNSAESFSQQLSNLIYTTANINTESYREKGYNHSKDSAGNIDIFDAKYKEIKEQIKALATDDTLSSKKSVIIQNINSAFENKKTEIENDKQNELKALESEYEIEIKQINSKIEEIKQEKITLESGNKSTGEKGLLQINNEIEKNRLQRNALEANFMVKKFWTVGTVFQILILTILAFYLSMFFASAMYKVFFEGNIIRNSLEAGINPGLPQIVDANAILKIFDSQGILFGVMALFFFLIPVLLSNLKLVGSKKKWVNTLCFWTGILIFDIVVSIMVAMNTDEIKNLLIGQQSQLKIWEVPSHGEFWLIFVFGMLPLIITHYIIESIVKTYKESQRETVDAEKNKQIEMLDEELLNYNLQKDILLKSIKEKEELLKQKNAELEKLEKQINTQKNNIEQIFSELLKNIKAIYDDFVTKITSGKIFTDEILNSVSTAYKSGYIEYLPELYSNIEVANRAKQIEQLISK
ncbi:phospholipase D-like domain-containing protein [Riemerella columbina]|uniref:phospholipase D-like domain-containing protein n=1 Tax=Riemerella columbina TaxID=103810 RepID=UPI00035E659C|nr:phospholipase D-like domain-containing protein [Riemerella columbina]